MKFLGIFIFFNFLCGFFSKFSSLYCYLWSLWLCMRADVCVCESGCLFVVWHREQVNEGHVSAEIWPDTCCGNITTLWGNKYWGLRITAHNTHPRSDTSEHTGLRVLPCTRHTIKAEVAIIRVEIFTAFQTALWPLLPKLWMLLWHLCFVDDGQQWFSDTIQGHLFMKKTHTKKSLFYIFSIFISIYLSCAHCQGGELECKQMRLGWGEVYRVTGIISHCDLWP